jgi:hypothetical protein
MSANQISMDQTIVVAAQKSRAAADAAIRAAGLN